MPVNCSARVALVALASCVVQVPTSAIAVGKPLACDLSRPLPAGNPAVFQRFTFNLKNNKTYRGAVYGLGQVDTRVRMNSLYQMCLKYEVENTGTETIRDFRWPDAGIYFVDIGPKQRLPKLDTPFTKYQNQGTGPTTIMAFRNESIQLRTAFTIERAEDKHAQLKDFRRYVFDSQIAATMSAAGLDKIAAPGFVLIDPDISQKYPPISSSFKLATGSIGLASEAAYIVGPNERLLEIYVNVFSDSGSDSDPTIFVPMINALEKLAMTYPNLKSTDDAIINIAQILDGLRKEQPPLTASGKSVSRKFVFPILPATKEVPRVFVVNHTVTVKVGDELTCIQAIMYSPVPVQSGAPHCRRG